MYSVNIRIMAVLACLAGFGFMAPAASAGDYAVVVNAANKAGGDDAALTQEVKRLYLLDTKAWSSGGAAEPYGRGDDTPEQAAFMAKVLDMSQPQLEAHWARLKQTKGEAAPRTFTSARLMLKFIEKNPGAFGIVTAEEEALLGPELRILLRFSD